MKQLARGLSVLTTVAALGCGGPEQAPDPECPEGDPACVAGDRGMTTGAVNENIDATVEPGETPPPGPVPASGQDSLPAASRVEPGP